jgi:hypothetical protein
MDNKCLKTKYPGIYMGQRRMKVVEEVMVSHNRNLCEIYISASYK